MVLSLILIAALLAAAYVVVSDVFNFEHDGALWNLICEPPAR